jgi:hypothetical protein
MSEVLYFLDASDIRRTAHRTMASLAANGVVVLVNFLGDTDTPCNGDMAAETFIAIVCERGTVRPMLQRRHAEYCLDVLVRPC